MKISVIIPTYNRSYIIREAIESVTQQLYDDFEVIVVDDGSADDTVEIVEGLHEMANLTCLRHERNRGYSAACNTGIRAARGEFVAFLDSDDLWKPDYLERQVTFLRRHPEVVVVFCDTEVRYQDTPGMSLMSLLHTFPKLIDPPVRGTDHIFSSRQMYLCLLEEVPIKPSAALIRRAALATSGYFDESWPSGTDWDLFLRLSRLGCFGYINEALAIQRRTADATHQKFREQDKLFLLGVFSKEKAAIQDDQEALRAVNRGIGKHCNDLAWSYLQSRQTIQAMLVYLRGFRETMQPAMLMKVALSFFPLRLRLAARNRIKPKLTAARQARDSG